MKIFGIYTDLKETDLLFVEKSKASYDFTLNNGNIVSHYVSSPRRLLIELSID